MVEVPKSLSESPCVAGASQGNQRRGRPRAVRASEMQRVALKLFMERGYSDTSVDDIAKEIGISRMTFFRYFPTKASVIWHDYEMSHKRLTAALLAADPATPLLEAVRDAIVSTVLEEAWDPVNVHARDKLIESEPALFPESAATSIRFANAISEHLNDRANFHVKAAPDAIGYAFLGATAGAVRISLLEGDDLPKLRLFESLNVMMAAMHAAFEFELKPLGK